MHELSVAQGIFDIVSETVPPDQLKNVRAVRVDIGEAAGISSESLEFSFAAIVRDTPLSGARLALHRVPFAIRCDDCHAITADVHYAAVCPRCNSASTRVVSGNELQIVDLELQEDPA